MRGYEFKDLASANRMIAELIEGMSMMAQTTECMVACIEKGETKDALVGAKLMIAGIPALIAHAAMTHGTEIPEAQAREAMAEAQAVNGRKDFTFSGPTKGTVH